MTPSSETAEAAFDRSVRAAIAGSIRERGVTPLIADVARELGSDVPSIDGSFARMIDQHVFIPQRGSHEIYAYDPFCVGPTDFAVRSAGRDWWAICGWDALGIPPALGTTGAVETTCVDCGDQVRVEVGLEGEATSPTRAVLHVGVPARAFWDDIRFT